MAFVSALVAAIGLTGTWAAVATFAIRTVLSIGVSKLIANRMGSTGAGAQEAGSRVQLPPATNNKLPVVYGSAFIGPVITDAKISTDQKTMWYVCAFNEVTDSTVGSSISFDEIYYDNKLVTFDGTDPAKVISLTTNTSGGGEVDTKVAGNLYIYKFTNGSFSGVNTGGQSAIQIMSDSDIPANQRWNQGIYTANGQSATMSNTAFLIVKVKYNQDAGTTQLGTLTAKVTNTVTKPGDVLKDYMLSERYGCGIPLSQIDTVSLAALNTYSDLPVYYTPAGGGPLTSQVRYRINGPIDTGQDCLTNMQYICDACDSWLQYSELTGKWKVVINQSYTEAGQTFNDLYSVTSSNIVGGIDVNPVDLNATYNELEVQYPNKYIKDQIDYVNISLFDDFPSLLSENEPINKLTMQSQIINNFVQAKFIGIRRILQSREDLIINFATDYSGIQTEAGDVIKVTLAEYGWTNKLFRVSNVIEEKYADGSLGARISAFEYNNSLYDDDLDITDFIPEDNTGLTDPNIIGTPNAPTVVLDLANTIAQMNVTGTVPAQGLVLNLDFNVGTDANSANHTYYSTVSNANGEPLLANSVYTISSNDLGADTYYWSVTARNRFVGVRSNASTAVTWQGGNVTTSNTYNACNASSSGTLVTSDSIANLIPGGLVTITTGTGTLQANTRVANVVSNTQFNLTLVPTVALSNACIKITTGGISGNNIQSNTITYNNLTPEAKGITVVTAYDVPNYGGSLQIPVSATSTTTRNIPLIYPGVSVANTVLFPYAQGTSSTTIGYSANSTSAWTPNTSALLYIANSASSYDGWYKLIDVNLSNVDWTTDELIVSQLQFNWYTDTANTWVQIVPYARFSNDAGNNVVQTQYMTMKKITDVFPYTDTISLTYNNPASSTVIGTGVYVRNITPSSNLTVYTGTYAVSQRVIGAGSNI